MENDTPAWPVLGLAALAILVGAFIPLPGLDYEAVHAFHPALLPPVAVIGETLPWLATVWLVLIGTGRETQPAARTIAFVVYLTVVAVQGIGIALYLESLNGVVMFDVVADPGWAFRLRTCLVWAAGAAFVWFLALRVEATGRARGALFLLLIRVAVDTATSGWDAGRAVGQGAEHALLLAVWVMPFAVALVGVAITFRPPNAWPVTFRGREIRSWWDALALVALAVIPGSFLSSLATWTGATPDVAWIDAAAAVSFGIAIVAWWFRAGGQGKRVPGPSLFGIALLMASVVPTLLGFFESGGLERALTPPPLAGESSFTIVLRAEGRFDPGDPAAMVTRLERLGARAEVLERSPERIRLAVNDALGPEPVLDALQPRHFELRMVVESMERDCAAVDETRPLQATGCEYRREAFPLEPGRCVFHCLEPEVRLSTGDVTDASVIADEWSIGVFVTLREDAAERFADLTGRSIGRKLGIVVDDAVMSAPVIQDRIAGGRIQISLGQGPDTIVQAEALAAALQPGAEIRTRWTFEAIE